MKNILKKLTIDNAILLLVLCMLGWAGNTIAGRLSADEISPMVIVFLRWAIVSSILFILKYQKIFITKEAKVTHLGAKSSNIGDEFEKCRNWHWMWSQFYFNKKVSNYFLAILKFLPKIFFLTLKVIFFYIVFDKYKSINSKMRLLGLLNSVVGNSSWYRPKII